MRLGLIFTLSLTALVVGCSLTSTSAQEEAESLTGLVQLIDPLDEPEFYCIDVPGFGNSLNLNGALTAHTCKLTGNDDEIFTFNSPAGGNFYMDAYDLCMEVEALEAGADLNLNDCSESESQVFVYKERGQIQPIGDENLCIAVSHEDGEPTGGPSHLRRDLALQNCDSTDASLMEWALGVETPQ